MSDALLVIVPGVPVWMTGENLVFDKKFYDGLMAYVQGWPGRVRCVMYRATENLPVYGSLVHSGDRLPFELLLLKTDEAVGADHLQGAGIVLVSGDHFGLLHVAGLCRDTNIRCVYLIEYTPETRRQIVAIETRGLWRIWRRYWFIWNGERRRIKAFRLADALQINGVPSWNTYAWHPEKLLFFDNRVRPDMVIGEGALQRRLAGMQAGRPLRLGFSGRLISIKGADDLVAVADQLRRAGLVFTLTIFGAGELDTWIRERIRQLQLSDVVIMMGPVDFENALLPTIRDCIDVYLLLHRQSDPSCTYLETLACGIPVIGYANQAFDGILQLADVGWRVDMNAISQVTATILMLDRQRELIAQKSILARQFALQHDFEATFGRRIEHLRQVACGSRIPGCQVPPERF